MGLVSSDRWWLVADGVEAAVVVADAVVVVVVSVDACHSQPSFRMALYSSSRISFGVDLDRIPKCQRGRITDGRALVAVVLVLVVVLAVVVAAVVAVAVIVAPGMDWPAN